MDTPLNFTLRYEDGTNDDRDHDGDVGVAGTKGTVWFEPNIVRGFRIPAPGGGLTPQTFVCIMENGVLKTRPGGSANVRIWANDPAWNMDRYSYLVHAELEDNNGNTVRWKMFELDAPKVDTVRYLDQYMPAPEQKFSQGLGAKLASARVEGNNLVMENMDGSTFSAAIPNGMSVLVDNGDSTWSVFG